MKEHKVYVTKRNLEGSPVEYQVYSQNVIGGRADRYEHATQEVACQYDIRRDNVVCTCRNPKFRRPEVGYFGSPKQIYAYHGTRSYTDIGVGSVKALMRKKVRKIYLPETDERGVGSSDLSSVIMRMTRPRENSYYDHKRTSSKCVGGIIEYNTGCVLSQKLSPIIQTKSGTTSPIQQFLIKNLEIGSNKVINTFNTTTTQVDTEVNDKGTIQSLIKVKEESKLDKHTTVDKQLNVDNQPKLDKQPKEKKSIGMHVGKSIDTKMNAADRVYSSDSLLQHVHNLEISSEEKPSHTSVDLMENKLEMEYRRIFSTISKEEKPRSRTNSDFKSSSILKRRFEALRRGLAKKEDSKRNAVLMMKTSSQISATSHKDVSIASDPPSLESRSYSNTKPFSPYTSIDGHEKRYNRRATYQDSVSSRKDRDSLQWPRSEEDSETQGVKGMFRLWGKKFNLEEDNAKRQPTPGPSIKISKKSIKEVEVLKATPKGDTEEKKDGRKFFFFKKKSKDKAKPYKQKKGVTTGRCEVRDGLMIKIGAANNDDQSEVVKETIPESVIEDYDEIVRKAWLKKYLTPTIESRNSVKIRWNNKTYATSSSTVFQLMDNVYKEAGVILKSRSEMTIAESSYYTSFTRQQVNYVYQNIETWMIPKTIPDRPIELPVRINFQSSEEAKNNIEIRISDQKWFIDKSEAFSHKIEIVLHSKNFVNVDNKKSSEYLRIDIPKGFFLDSSSDDKRNQSSDEQVYNIVEYETGSELKKNKIAQSLSTGDHKANDIEVTVNVASKDVDPEILETVIKTPATHRDVVIQGSDVYIPKRCDVIGVGIITRRDLKKIGKPILKIRDDVSDEESEHVLNSNHRNCKFAERYLQDYYQHCHGLTPLGLDFYSRCVSDSLFKCCSETSKTSYNNHVEGTQSCPNIFDDFQPATVMSSCETSSGNRFVAYVDENKTNGSKFIAKIMTSKVEKELEGKTRVLPKDSLEVFKKRKLYALSNKSKWASADDDPYSVPSNESRGAQKTMNGSPNSMKSRRKVAEVKPNKKECKKYVSMPDCGAGKILQDSETPEIPGILAFKGLRECGNCKEPGSPKTATIKPGSVTEISKPPCQEACEKMKEPPCVKLHSPINKLSSKSSPLPGMPVPKPGAPSSPLSKTPSPTKPKSKKKRSPTDKPSPIMRLPPAKSSCVPQCPSNESSSPIVKSRPPVKKPSPPAKKQSPPPPPPSLCPPTKKAKLPSDTPPSGIKPSSPCKASPSGSVPSSPVRKGLGSLPCIEKLCPPKKSSQSPPKSREVSPKMNPESPPRSPKGCGSPCNASPSGSVPSSPVPLSPVRKGLGSLPCIKKLCPPKESSQSPPKSQDFSPKKSPESPPRSPKGCGSPCNASSSGSVPSSPVRKGLGSLPCIKKLFPPKKSSQSPPKSRDFSPKMSPDSPPRSPKGCGSPCNDSPSGSVPSNPVRKGLGSLPCIKKLCPPKKISQSPPKSPPKVSPKSPPRSPKGYCSPQCKEVKPSEQKSSPSKLPQLPQTPLPAGESVWCPLCKRSSDSSPKLPGPLEVSPKNTSKNFNKKTKKNPCIKLFERLMKSAKSKSDASHKNLQRSKSCGPCPECNGPDLDFPWPCKNQISNQSLFPKYPSAPTEDLQKIEDTGLEGMRCSEHPKVSQSSDRSSCCISNPTPGSPNPVDSQEPLEHKSKAKISGVRIKMNPGTQDTKDDSKVKCQVQGGYSCIRLNSKENLTIRMKPQSPSTEEIRYLPQGKNFKVQDDDGKTLYERRDYIATCSGGQHPPSVLGEMYRNSNVIHSLHRISKQVIGEATTTNKPDDEMKQKSDASLSNIIEIQFQMKVTQGEKTTEIAIANDEEEKKKAFKPPEEVFIVNNDSKRSNESKEPKNDINIRIVIKNFKSKSEKKKRCYNEAFSKEISDKFHTVSTGYSNIMCDENTDNAFSVHRATVDLTTSGNKFKTTEITNALLKGPTGSKSINIIKSIHTAKISKNLFENIEKKTAVTDTSDKEEDKDVTNNKILDTKVDIDEKTDYTDTDFLKTDAFDTDFTDNEEKSELSKTGDFAKKNYLIDKYDFTDIDDLTEREDLTEKDDMTEKDEFTEREDLTEKEYLTEKEDLSEKDDLADKELLTKNETLNKNQDLNDKDNFIKNGLNTKDNVSWKKDPKQEVDLTSMEHSIDKEGTLTEGTDKEDPTEKDHSEKKHLTDKGDLTEKEHFFKQDIIINKDTIGKEDKIEKDDSYTDKDVRNRNKKEVDFTERSSSHRKDAEVKYIDIKDKRSFQQNFKTPISTDTDDQELILEANTSTDNDTAPSIEVIIKPHTRDEKKEMLKEVFEKAHETNVKSKTRMKKLRDMLKTILTSDSSGHEDITINELAKDLTYESLKPRYFRDSDSMNNYYNCEAISDKESNTRPAAYPTEEKNSACSKSSDVESSEDALTHKECMCSALAARLNLCKVTGGGCCCCRSIQKDEQIDCNITSDFHLNLQAETRYIDVETQNSKYCTTKNSNEKTIHNYTTSSIIETCNIVKVEEKAGVSNAKRIEMKPLKMVLSPHNQIKECQMKKLNKDDYLTISDDDKIVLLGGKEKVPTEVVEREMKNNVGKNPLLRASDILQSYETKKAVLEIYAERTISGEDEHFVAKLPKFVYDRENEILMNYEAIASNTYKALCKRNIIMMSIKR